MCEARLEEMKRVGFCLLETTNMCYCTFYFYIEKNAFRLVKRVLPPFPRRMTGAPSGGNLIGDGEEIVRGLAVNSAHATSKD